MAYVLMTRPEDRDSSYPSRILSQQYFQNSYNTRERYLTRICPQRTM